MKTAFRWYIFAVSRVESFHGRAGRQECASFFIFQALFLLIAAGLDYFLAGFPVVLPIYAVLTAIPTILLFIRRLHDCGYSGWWTLIAILPPFCFFVMCWAPDPDQPNKYGTTERLPSKELLPTQSPQIIDGIEYLTEPPQPFMPAAKRREIKREEELNQIIKGEQRPTGKESSKPAEGAPKTVPQETKEAALAKTPDPAQTPQAVSVFVNGSGSGSDPTDSPASGK